MVCVVDESLGGGRRVPSVDARPAYIGICFCPVFDGCDREYVSLAAVWLGKPYRIVNAYASGENIVETSAYQLASYCGEVVGEDFTVKVVAFVLDYACQISGDFFIVFFEVLIEPLQTYMFDALDVFGDAGETETSLAAADALAVEYGHAWIDECHATVNAFGEYIAYGRSIDDYDAIGAAYLRRCQAYAFAGIHGLKHIGHEFFQLGILGRDVLALLAQHRLAQQVYR